MERSRSENGEVLNILAMILWSVWSSRNNLIFKHWVPDILTTARRGITLLADFNEAGRREMVSPQPNARWSPPRTHWVKVNTNAASLGNNRWGLEMVCRDDHGTLKVTATCSVLTMDHPEVAECLALRWALNLVWSQIAFKWSRSFKNQILFP